MAFDISPAMNAFDTKSGDQRTVRVRDGDGAPLPSVRPGKARRLVRDKLATWARDHSGLFLVMRDAASARVRSVASAAL